MSALTFADLRAAYTNGDDVWRHDDWLVALGGEIGEALNLIKKLNRDRLKMLGNSTGWDALVEQLGDELADVVIYLDLLALKFSTERLAAASAFVIRDFDRLRECTVQNHAFSAPSLHHLSSAGRQLIRQGGRLADLAPVSNEQFAEQCDWLLSSVDATAWNAGLALGDAVVRKFNATSAKLGFPERLAA
jgi:NTP pyrophosphatase (non-canonical NTP hydrolase)